MPVKIELAFPLKNVEHVYEFGNFQVGKKYQNSNIEDIIILFFNNYAKVIIFAVDNENIKFSKEFICEIGIEILFNSCIVTFNRIYSNNQNWYSISSLFKK